MLTYCKYNGPFPVFFADSKFTIGRSRNDRRDHSDAFSHFPVLTDREAHRANAPVARTGPGE